MKISNMIIGILLIGLVSIVFGLAMSDISVNSDANVSYDSSTLDSFERTNEIMDLVNETQTKAFNVENPSLFDILGSIAFTALNAFKISFSSFGVFTGMMLNMTGLLNINPVFFSVLVAILLIGIVFLFISVMLKRDV
jgi:hypothetical protein